MPSTQDAARQLVEREGTFAAGRIVSTGYQTAGRGRQGKTWHAPPGANVLQTAIGSPVALNELWQLSFVAALAVVDALVAVAPDAHIRVRFPNDVLLVGKKVAGVLIETAIGPEVPEGTLMPLIGVGINVLGTVDALPPEVAVRATTLEAVTGVAHPVGMVQAHLARALTVRWNERRTGEGFRKILAAWTAWHDPDARRVFVLEGASVLCRVAAVTEAGEATLELPDGSRRTVPVPQIVLA